jgi:sporulation protein YlmC with PRC-barrel domain
MNILKTMGFCAVTAAVFALGTTSVPGQQAEDERGQGPVTEQEATAPEHGRPMDDERSQMRDPEQQQRARQDDQDDWQERGQQDRGIDFEEGMVADGQHADLLDWSAWREPPNSIHSEDLVGKEIRDADGTTALGQVDNLILDEHGQLIAIVARVGGRLGFGGRSVVVPWEAVHPAEQEGPRRFIRVEADQETFADLPEYERPPRHAPQQQQQ